MLCSICQKITFRTLAEFRDTTDIIPTSFKRDRYIGRYQFYQHQPSRAALYLSQLDGCHFCAVLWFALEEYGLPKKIGPGSKLGVWLSYHNWPAGAEVKRIEVICGDQTTSLDVLKTIGIPLHIHR
jgi:hypothetical protein